MLTDLSFLECGKAFPPNSEKYRLETYLDHRKLFENNHAEVYKEQFRRIERVIGNFDRVVSYGTVFNYQRLLSVKTADLVFGEPPRVTVADDSKQTVIDKILLDTDLFGCAYISCIDVSRYGDAIMLLSCSNKGLPSIDVISPAMWFPVVNQDNIRQFQYHVFAWVYLIDTVKKQYGLKVQIHKPDEPEKCEAHNYELNGKPGSFKIGREITQKQELNLETSMNTCPVYRISNLLTSDNIYGHDDYEPIDSIVAEIIVRVSQISKVLDKFASPSMTGPQSALEMDEATGTWRLKVGDYFPCDNDTIKPEYLVWDASMDANFKQIELLTNQLYTISEMGSAVFGDLTNKAGDVPSGSALRRLMMSPLAKARRLANRFDPILKKIISASAGILGVEIAPEEITITWHDGLPADPAEDAEIMSVRTGGKATLSQYTAIQRLDDMSAADTDAELAMIRSDDIDSSVGLEETALEPIEGI